MVFEEVALGIGSIVDTIQVMVGGIFGIYLVTFFVRLHFYRKFISKLDEAR